MISTSSSFRDIYTEIHYLQRLLPASFLAFNSIDFRRLNFFNPLKELQALNRTLKTVVSIAETYAKKTQDKKVKEAVCRQLLTLNSVLQQNENFSAYRNKHQTDPTVLHKIEVEVSQMRAKVHNALIRGNDRQEVWGSQFCPEAAFSDTHWEETIATSKLLPVVKQSFFKYYFLFNLSLLYVRLCALFTPQKWWNKIPTTSVSGAHLYLGGLPLKTPFCNPIEEAKKEGFGAVLSMVETFENNSTGTIYSPVTPREWESAGVKQLQIPMEDFHTGPVEDVEKGVEFIRWNLLQGRSVYVHCKAGKGRSALVVMAYLVKYEGLTANQALTHVRAHRYQAGFREENPKMATLREYERRIRGS